MAYSMNHTLLEVLIIGMGLLFLAIPSVAGEIIVSRNPERPGLFLSREEIAAARKRIETEPWAKASWESLKKNADGWLSQSVSVPQQSAGHIHRYFCPECGSQLLYEADRPTEHRCPKCHKTYTGEPYDSAWRVRPQDSYGSAALTLGLAYQLSGDRRYAEKAAQILIAYAKAYPDYTPQIAKGRAYWQSLDEAVWTINLAWAYDLIADSGALSPEDCEKVERDLLKASAEQISTNKVKDNWQTWHNSAMAAVGWCIGDEALVRTALEDPVRGAFYQLGHDLLPDGFQIEGSIGYHYYALSAFRWTLEAAWHHGLNLYDRPGVKRAFLGPIQTVMPDGSFPVINDSGGAHLKGSAPFCEIAYARTGDPIFGNVLRLIYDQFKATRSSQEALLYGKSLPEAGSLPTHSSLLANTGLAVLRAGGNYALMKFGPYGGGHGHLDKLGIIFYALDQLIAPDLGSSGYGIPLYKTWNQKTAAHNTMGLDRASQKPASGKLRNFIASPQVQMVDAVCDSAYPDSKLRRVLWLTPECLVDFFQVDSSTPKPRCIDWLWHAWGTPEAGIPLAPRSEPLGTGDGYQHLTNLRSGVTDDDWSVDWTPQSGLGRVRITMLGEPGTEVVLADGPGTIPSQKLPAMVVRRHAKETMYRTVVEPMAGESRIREMEPLSGDNLSGIRLRMVNGSVHVYALAAGMAKADGIELDRGTASACFDASGMLNWLQLSGGTRLKVRSALVELDSEGSVWICRDGDGYRVGMESGSGKLHASLPGLAPFTVELEAGKEIRVPA